MNEKFNTETDIENNSHNEANQKELLKTLAELGLYGNASENNSTQELHLEKGTDSDENKENAVAKLLSVIAWFIFILGSLMGIVLAASSGGFVLGLLCLFGAAIGCVVMLALAEIIKLLNAIKNK